MWDKQGKKFVDPQLKKFADEMVQAMVDGLNALAIGVVHRAADGRMHVRAYHFEACCIPYGDDRRQWTRRDMFTYEEMRDELSERVMDKAEIRRIMREARAALGVPEERENDAEQS